MPPEMEGRAPDGIGARLKEARLARGMTLEDLSLATRINVDFLIRIENDDDLSLPGIYRRTFIRTIAKELGFDPDELTGYEPEPETQRDEAGEPEGISVEPPVERTIVTPVLRNPFAERSQVRTMAIIVVFLLTAFVLSVKWLGDDGQEPVSSGEVPAGTPRERSDLTAFGTRTADGDSAGPGAVDSLTLRATSTDTVWIQVLIDGTRKEEFLMPPRYTVTLRAAENFLLTVGKPSGLEIWLNGRRMDVLGTGERAKKNVYLSRKLLSD